MACPGVQHVRYGSKADICNAKRHVRFAPNSDRKREFPQKAIDKSDGMNTILF
jgi:hypothetical protein